MRANPARTGSIWRRFAAVAVALALFTAFAPGASADIGSQLNAAKARLAEIKREVAAQNVKLAGLEAAAAKLATKVGDAQAAFDAISAVLSQTKHDLAAARIQYQALRDQLDARARETYMQGPGSDIEFILGATSLTDLSDRLEYVNALTQSDSDLATQVQNLRNDLAAKAAKQASLQADRASKLSALQGAQAALDASLAQQQQILSDIQAKQTEAEALVKKLGKEYQDYLASLFGVKFYNGTFKTCPSEIRTASGTTSARRGTPAASTTTQATTSSRRSTLRSALRSTAPPARATTGSAATRSSCTERMATCTTRTWTTTRICRTVRCTPVTSSDTSATRAMPKVGRPTITSSGIRTSSRRTGRPVRTGSR